MKWFKHMTNAMDDLFVKDIERKFGDTGYAFWFKTLELIGNHGECGVLKISWSNYLEKLHKRRTQVEQLLNFCSTSDKLTVTIKENELIIECKKFAEYSDNYTKYSKTLQSNFKDTSKQEVEEEVDKKKKKSTKKDVVFKIPDRLMEMPFLGAWINFQTHRIEIKKPLTKKAGEMLLARLSNFSPVIASQMLNQSIENGWQGVFELKGNSNGHTTKPTNPNSATARATFRHGEAEKQHLNELQATIDRRDRERGFGT